MRCGTRRWHGDNKRYLVTEQGGGNELRRRWLGVQDDEMEDMRHRGLRDRMTNIKSPPPGLLLDDQAPNPWA
jgi:hypothetical protein